MSYLWAGYGLTWLALAVYAWRLERRQDDAERELSFLQPDARTTGDGHVRTAGDGHARTTRPDRGT